MAKQNSGANAIQPNPAQDTPLARYNKAQTLTTSDIQNEILQTDSEVVSFWKNVFIPTWDNKPPEVPALLTLSGTPVLTFQNLLSIIALPGVGKSSIGESIAANILNPDADTLGFAVSALCGRILFVDNERTTTDVWNSFYRMCKRAGIAQGTTIDRVMLVGLRSISRAAERKRIIEQMLQESQYGIVIIDGAGDLVEDVNDLAQAIECRIWLREMTVKYQVSIITTLHPNPGINASKPRGHLGSEVCRESECVLLAKKVDETTRIITTEFENGKNRNSAPITSAYRWCDDAGMFITADAGAIAGTGSTRKNNSQAKLELLALKVLAPPKALCYTDLCKAITEVGGYAGQTAKTKVKEMKSAELINVHPDGYYRLAA